MSADTASATGKALRRRSWMGAVLNFLLGAACALGQAPWGLWPVTIIALSILFWRIGTAATTRAACLKGGVAGAGYFALALSWIVEPFLVQPEIYGWMAPFALILMAAGGGVFWAVPGWLAGRLTNDRLARVAAFAAALVLSDWLRGWIFTGFPWTILGHIWIGTPAAQAASFIGGIGLSALTVAAAALPVLFQRSHGPDWHRFLPGSIISLLLIAVVWAGGLLRLDTKITMTGKTIRLVQPNAEQALKWDPDWAQIFWERLLTESAAPPEGPPPDAVIWPETAVGFLLNQADDILPVISEAAGAPVLMGIQRAEDERYYNALIEITREGTLAETYDKFHLVPFGEYIPWGDFLSRLGIGAFAAQQGYGYTPGPGPAVMTPEGLPPLQPLICYEAIFPQHLRSVNGAKWLLQVTNDAWFGTISGPYQHLAQARLRAIESGMPLMRAANTGITAAIDPLGRITSSLPLGAMGHIDAGLAAPLGTTFWTRTGPLPVLLISFAVLFVAALRRRR
ncbi:apolipoprotein N-acyltransferase [Paracoccus aerodenitrificans]|uniref:apolipoprotein N-acyltransferase n=1 Tax=Paracoccus aerodenitrificans TaxID=3017781 RepID=UPI0022F000E3|nr:apolipoprotein N-acyltransferase [Paracoccus aerodenitrificans]WBU62854.1 apolipoprotein N-acyltransferase [Paracoccus aerodenitrificans]